MVVSIVLRVLRTRVAFVLTLLDEQCQFCDLERHAETEQIDDLRAR